MNMRRLNHLDYPVWRPLAEASQREQCVPNLRYWEKWQDSYLIWGVHSEGRLVAYVFIVEVTPYIEGGLVSRYKLRELARPLRWGIADLYVLPDYRGRGIPQRIIQAALHDLGVQADEAIALSMPVQRRARSALKGGLGENRLVVGYMTNGYITQPMTIDAVIERSRKFVKPCPQQGAAPISEQSDPSR